VDEGVADTFGGVVHRYIGTGDTYV